MPTIDKLVTQTSGIKTKLKILHALDKPLNDLSVKEICENAGISRDTFYRHFTSKYDILIWHGKLIQSQYLDEAGRTLDFRTAYCRHFNSMAEKGELYSVVFKNMGRQNNEFPEMNEHRKNIILETLQDWRNIKVDDDMLFCIEAFVQLETMLVSHWLGDGCIVSPHIFADRIVSIIPNRLYDAMELQHPVTLQA